MLNIIVFIVNIALIIFGNLWQTWQVLVNIYILSFCLRQESLNLLVILGGFKNIYNMTRLKREVTVVFN